MDLKTDLKPCSLRDPCKINFYDIVKDDQSLTGGKRESLGEAKRLHLEPKLCARMTAPSTNCQDNDAAI